jgi:UDP-N-acetylglucosamine 2-epimerase (hydrolysing)
MKKIVFLTGTRADYGKLKSYIKILEVSKNFEVYIFVTGMHLNQKFGFTINEIKRNTNCEIYPFINHSLQDEMDQSLGKTIIGFSDYIKQIKPDMILIHGDRIEALAGAIVGSLNNILVGHIEGGEVSGTIDELLRHSISKLSHIHFVSNEGAKNRLIQMGEISKNIFVTGSPDLDIMLSDDLPDLSNVKERYNIMYDSYGILIYHPVTTELNQIANNAKILVDSLIESNQNIIVIYPNNDLGNNLILNEFKRLDDNTKFKIIPSMRFEYFIQLLKNSDFIIGNSSAGIREAPYFSIPTINLGTRQLNRSKNNNIINCSENKLDILNAINLSLGISLDVYSEFGLGNSDKLFKKIISKKSTWNISKQKLFFDLNN